MIDQRTAATIPTMTPAMQAIHDSPLVLVLSELGHALPTVLLEAVLTRDYDLCRPEMFVSVTKS